MTFSNNNPFALPHHSHPGDMDSKLDPHCFEDLDSTLIDTSLISPAMERKDSFATSTYTPFSPQSSTNPWSDEAYSIPPSSTSSAHPERHLSMSSHMGDPVIGSNNPFLQHQQNQFQWAGAVYDRNGSKTPLLMPAVTYDFSPEFDASTTTAYPQAGSGFNNGMPMLTNVRPAAIMPPTAGAASLSTSPQPQPGQPTKEWMALAEQDMDSSRLPKRIRQNSPQRPLTPGFARREGVRKKNARFDIPEGRSLHNIDQLIAQATAQGADDDIKELKQQKRLLRNRQAALDSRQRKKKHTEELEKEQKVWLEHRGDYEARMEQLQEDLEQMKLHNLQMEHQNSELIAQVHRLTHEKQSQLEEHTQETMMLRTKINALKDQLQSSPPLTSHHSTMFGDFTSELDQLTVSEWDDLIMEGVDDDSDSPNGDSYNIETPNTATTTLIVGKSRNKDTSLDQPIASGGFLLMLLLYGAIVASKSSGTTAPQMPGMSDEIRVASAHIVDNILKDGNTVTQAASSIIQGSSRTSMQAVPSMPAWVQPQAVNNKKHTVSFQGFPSSNKVASKLDSMASSMLAPSKEALTEAAFGLTPAQYNSLTSDDFASHNTYLDDETMQSMNARRKTLVENLRQMREEAEGGSVAEVYKRSLLWERIPEDVLQDFRRMVEENSRNDRDDSKGVMT